MSNISDATPLAKPKTIEEADARVAEQQAASEFVGELRAEKAQEELRNKKGKFISDNAADIKESTFLNDLLKGGWDKSLDDVQAGRITPQRAATLAQAAAEAGLIDAFTSKRFTPETVPNVEITVDEPGAAEVGLGMENIPEIPSAVSVAIQKEMAPDVNYMRVLRAFGKAEADRVASTKPSQAEQETLAQAKQIAKENGWSWDAVVEKVRQQLGLDTDFLKPDSNEARQLAAFRKADKEAEAAVKRTEAMVAESQKELLEKKQQKEREDAAKQEQAKAERDKQAEGRARAEEAADEGIRQVLKPEAYTLYAAKKTKKEKQAFISQVALRSGSRDEARIKRVLENPPAAQAPTPEPAPPAKPGQRDVTKPEQFTSKALRFKRQSGVLVVGGRMIAERFQVTYLTAEAAPGFKNVGAPMREKKDIGMLPGVVADRLALLDTEYKAFSELANSSKLAAREFATRHAPDRMKDHMAAVRLLRQDGVVIDQKVIIELP